MTRLQWAHSIKTLEPNDDLNLIAFIEGSLDTREGQEDS